MPEDTLIQPAGDRFADLEQGITALSPDAPMDAVCALKDRMEFCARRLRELVRLLDDRTAEWIESNGEFTIGDVRYYTGPDRETRCEDVPAALEALLTVSEGDWQKLAGFLSSGAIKYGAAREVLDPSTYAKLFRTTEKTVVKEGKAKRVKSVNVKFLPSTPQQIRCTTGE